MPSLSGQNKIADLIFSFIMADSFVVTIVSKINRYIFILMCSHLLLYWSLQDGSHFKWNFDSLSSVAIKITNDMQSFNIKFGWHIFNSYSSKYTLLELIMPFCVFQGDKVIVTIIMINMINIRKCFSSQISLQTRLVLSKIQYFFMKYQYK